MYLFNKTITSLKNQLGKTPLLAACEIGSIKIANLLIDAGADVNKADVVSYHDCITLWLAFD